MSKDHHTENSMDGSQSGTVVISARKSTHLTWSVQVSKASFEAPPDQDYVAPGANNDDDNDDDDNDNDNKSLSETAQRTSKTAPSANASTGHNISSPRGTNTLSSFQGNPESPEQPVLRFPAVTSEDKYWKAEPLPSHISICGQGPDEERPSSRQACTQLSTIEISRGSADDSEMLEYVLGPSAAWHDQILLENGRDMYFLIVSDPSNVLQGVGVCHGSSPGQIDSCYLDEVTWKVYPKPSLRPTVHFHGKSGQ